MKYVTEDIHGTKKSIQMSGTAQLFYKITNSVYIILTCAHNFIRFEKGYGENAGKTLIKRIGDSDAYFMFQCDGGKKHKAHFRMVQYFCHPNYENT